MPYYGHMALCIPIEKEDVTYPEEDVFLPPLKITKYYGKGDLPTIAQRL